MANAVEVDIAEAIKEELNSATFVVKVVAERSEADATVPLTELGTLKVDVVPWTATSSLQDRAVIGYVVETDILIRKRFESSEQDGEGRVPTVETDRLRQLRQEIAEFFMPSQPTYTGRALTDVPGAHWRETKVVAAMVRPHFKQYRQFTAWIRVIHQLGRVR